MAVSADALDDEEWWLDPSEREKSDYSAKRKGSPNSEKPKKKKRKTISQELLSQKQKSDAFSYTKYHQRQEMWSFLSEKLAKSTTAVEMSQFNLPVESFTGYHSDDQSSQPEFCQYFSTVCSKIDEWVKKIGKERGSPCVIIITSSASRALQLRHQLIESRGMKNVAKLFAKHMKIEEQKQHLKESVIPVAVATPDRLIKLLNDGSVGVSKLRRIIFDWNWRNQKLKRLVDIPEVGQSVCELYKEHLNELIVSKSKLKLSLY